MKWALKFSTKGKGATRVPVSKQGSLRNGGEAPGEGGFKTSSDGDGGEEGGEYYGENEQEQGQERSTPVLTPPDANGGTGANGGGPEEGERHSGGGGGESPATEQANEGEGVDFDNNASSAPPFTVDSGVIDKDRVGEEQMEYQRQQDGVFDDDDGDSQPNSVQASKTARMRSFADDPEAHTLGDADADWDAAGNSRPGSPRGSRGDDRFSGNDGDGSDSDHSEGNQNGMHTAEEEGYNSNRSRAPTSADGGGGKGGGYNSFGGGSGGSGGGDDPRGRPLDDEEGEEEELGEDQHDVEDIEEEEEEQDDERHHGVGNGERGGAGGGLVYGNSGERTARDQADLERRAMAHAYADGLDGVASREAGGYSIPGDGYGGRGMDRHQQHNMPPAPPGGVNGISPVDARAAAALAARTRLAAGGVSVPERAGVQRPEQAPVLAPGQAAAAAAAAALRRGPTPGSHSLPSMVLVPLEALKAHRRVPRSSDRRALVRYRDLPDRSRSFVVFVSHAWMRPHTTPSFAHPDTSSRGGEKYRLIAEAGDRIRAHLPPDVRVLLWIDYSCVDQDSTRRSKATMRGMREYMRRCDAILTVYPGDAADNGEEFLPNRFVKSCGWAGSYKSLAHYCTRGWCRLEMLLGQTEPLPQDGFMFNFLVPKKKKASGAKASVGDRPHFLYGAHQRPHNGRIDVVPRQSSRWFEEHHPEQGNFTHESDRDAIRAVLAKQTSTMAKRSAAIAARYGTDPRRGGGGGGSGATRGGGGGGVDRESAEDGDYGRPH